MAQRPRPPCSQGTASWIVGAIRNAEADVIARHRRQLPDLWERLDRLVELVDDRDKGWTSDLR